MAAGACTHRTGRGGGGPGAAAADAGRAGRAGALLGGFWRRDKEGGLTAPWVATRREGKPVACKLYRLEEGRALYAGVLKAGGALATLSDEQWAALKGRLMRCGRAPDGRSGTSGGPSKGW